MMICEKCGTENKEDTSYCKKCGEDLIPKENTEGEASEKVEGAKEEGSVKTAVRIEKKSVDRVRTSPLAVRMQEKSNKENKKIKKKIRRSKMWAAIAIVLALVLIIENVFLMRKGPEKPVQEQTGTPAVTQQTGSNEKKPVTYTSLSSEALEGEWTYTYKLKKNKDSDYSGDYETVTEVIESMGDVVVYDKGENRMLVMLVPHEMKVDGNVITIGDTPEVFFAKYNDATRMMDINFKGSEQKFFAPGGGKVFTMGIPLSIDTKGVVHGGTFDDTYEMQVSGLRMKYEMTVTFEKK